MDEVTRLLREEASRIEPSLAGLAEVLRRARRHRRRQRLGAAVVSLLLTAAAVAIWSPWLRVEDRAPEVAPPTSTVSSFPTAPVGPSRLVDGAFGAGSAWALACELPCPEPPEISEGWLLRVDPRSGKITGSISVEDPHALAVGEGGIWVIGFVTGTVTHIDPATGRVVATIPPRAPTAMTSSADQPGLREMRTSAASRPYPGA